MKKIATILLFVTPAMWSVNYLVARGAAGVIEPNLLALLRWSLALALMLPFAYTELVAKRRLIVDEWWQSLLLGALGMWICGAFVYLGGKTTTAINIGLLYAMAPVLIAVVSAKLFDDSLGWIQSLGAILACMGCLFIVTEGRWENLAEAQFKPGDGWVLIAVISWTSYSVLLRLIKSQFSSFSRLVLITSGGILVLIPFTLYELSAVGAPQDWNQAFFLVVLVAVLPGFGAYQAYSFMQLQLGAARTGLVLYLGPLYAAMLAWIFLGEIPESHHVTGALLILPGIYLASTGVKKNYRSLGDIKDLENSP